MKIPTLSLLSVFALLGMALAAGYGGYGYGASYVPVAVHPGYGYGGGIGSGIGSGGLCESWFTYLLIYSFFFSEQQGNRSGL